MMKEPSTLNPNSNLSSNNSSNVKGQRKVRLNKRYSLLALDAQEEMIIELLRQLPTSSDFLFLDPPSFPTQIRASKQPNLHKWCNFNDSIASSIRSSAMESFRETGRFPESNLDYLIDSSGLEQLIQPKNGVTIHRLHDFNMEAAKLNEEQTKKDTVALIIEPLSREQCSLEAFHSGEARYSVYYQ
ncbi:hypothetical protein WR25_03719 [Diploscapter pachys]|uniref:Uncharacterized protein n=1 Tax=Diploscapter pachys TaxID=2018661 RepID=A0A2A2LNY7_9BILA|nr:hypothetical protein WR25_03719 [Diploscapter pachys]